MAIRHLSSLTRRARKPNHAFTSRRYLPTALSTASYASRASPPPPTAMYYDRLAENVKLKLKTVEHPDHLFLRYNSPHPAVASHAKILSTPLTRVTTLPNGLRIATESTLASETATVGVFVDAGSRYESEVTNGTAHFLEHMIFKGTERRSATDLVEEIENMGGSFDAYTTKDKTAYYAWVMDKDVSHALDILSDILQNSRFDEQSIARERRAILVEMAAIEGQTTQVIFDHLHATAFQHTSLGRPVLGLAKNVKTITREHLQNYISTHYTAPRMVIAAAGAVRHEDVVEEVKKLFTKLSTNPTKVSELVAKEPGVFTGSEIRMLDDDIPLAEFAIAFEGASWTDPDSIALMVMKSMLGYWDKTAAGGKHMGSELAQRVGINQIAEKMRAFNMNHKDTGLFGVYAVAKPDCLDDLAHAIMYEITKLCYQVTDADVIRARNRVKSNLLLNMDGTSAVAINIGRQLLKYGRRIPYAELVARIDCVDVNTIKRVANRFIFDRDMVISAIGPIQGLPDYNWFRRRTYWLRY